MKNGPFFFFGLFAALAIAWAGIVLGSHAQLGALAPYFDEGESQVYPLRASGVAARGQLVYADLGCAACHTQQARRPDYGSDKARGWAERQSVARDYIFQARPQLGAMRLGPDLTNFGARKPAPTADAVMKLLYGGSPSHPSYSFLFDEREVTGQRSANALGVTAPAGREIVPTERAQSLVAYLLSLNNSYAYPEARPYEAPKAETAKKDEKAAAPKKIDVTPIPAAPPDEQKKEAKK